ncbi:hypothetical protein [Desulfocurvus sp. DL9XJH121]
MTPPRLIIVDAGGFILAARELGLCPRFIQHTGPVAPNLSEKLLEADLAEQDVFFKPADMGRLLTRRRPMPQTREP